jgi:Plavaka transposase
MLEMLPDLRSIWMRSIITTRWGTPITRGPGLEKGQVVFYHRNPCDAIQTLLDRPSLHDHLEFVPRRVYTNKDRHERIYNEIMTGDWAWRVQVRLSIYAGISTDSWP